MRFSDKKVSQFSITTSTLLQLIILPLRRVLLIALFNKNALKIQRAINLGSVFSHWVGEIPYQIFYGTFQIPVASHS